MQLMYPVLSPVINTVTKYRVYLGPCFQSNERPSPGPSRQSFFVLVFLGFFVWFGLVLVLVFKTGFLIVAWK